MIETPQNIKPYVEALGEDLALQLIMQFGGSPIYVPARPSINGELGQLVGVTGLAALAKILGPGQIARVPIGREWTVRQLKARHWSTLAIARELRVTDETVRRILNNRDGRQASFSF